MLEYLADGKESDFCELAKILDLPEDEICSIVRALTNKGFLLQDSRRQTVRIGTKISLLEMNRQDRRIKKVVAPKGIDKRTLHDIKGKIISAPPEWEVTAEEMAGLIGFSRVTARRYLEYLVEAGLMRRRNQYIQVGRPIAKYRLLAFSGNDDHDLEE